MMSNTWFRKITTDPSDFGRVMDAIDHFMMEYHEAERELTVKGKRIDAVASHIPGIIAFRYAQLQELEMILKHMEVLVDREIVKQTKWFMESYPRAITEPTARKYAEAHDDVFARVLIKHEVAVARNCFLSLFKGIEAMHYQIRNIVELRKAGIEDAEFS
ncbi:MAG: hypothetical protein EOP83_03395 [Verrucomicrobiaceae bacterium]|nr:MAG: hypothetical protein EOP83_03395 [Verrucomicrobiaceae bacterium]